MSTEPVTAQWGELFDKVTVLEIKLKKISDKAARHNVSYELGLLLEIAQDVCIDHRVICWVKSELATINDCLLQIEDEIREVESNQSLGETFVALARFVYITNDHRSTIKRQINTLLKSAIIEEKSYKPY